MEYENKTCLNKESKNNRRGRKKLVASCINNKTSKTLRTRNGLVQVSKF